jgi:catechol 2,3-dioxygenase-like lactoylglutathione lyase family enzyme
MGIRPTASTTQRWSAATIYETKRFYTEVLGMRLVLEQPNLDDEEQVHLFFEAGAGQFFAYFVPKEGSLP